ncbi:hypothetical protein D3C86_909210 [compost metagenome]
MRRRNVDDAAKALLLHVRQRGRRAMEHGRQVQRQNGIPLFNREIFDQRGVLDAGVIDKDVDAAQLAHRVVHQATHRIAFRQVGAVVDHLHAVFLGQTGALLFDRGGVAKTIQDDISALLGEGGGDPQADTAGGTGDKGNFSFEHVHSPVVWHRDEKRNEDKCSRPRRRQSCHDPTAGGVKQTGVCRTNPTLARHRRPKADPPCRHGFPARAPAA